jgi:hypothetical protein
MLHIVPVFELISSVKIERKTLCILLASSVPVTPPPPPYDGYIMDQ